MEVDPLPLIRPAADADPTFVKSCCANLYASPWATWLLGDAFHPGGLPLSLTLARLAGVTATTTILDLAAGRGATAVHLATQIGCRVIAVDYGAANVAAGRLAATAAGVADRIRFIQGDAEALPLPAGVCDVVLCECAFCTFPVKSAAAAEIARVLRPGGRLALSDLTRHGPLPNELTGLLAWISCLADARPIAEYTQFIDSAGLQVTAVDPHDYVLSDLIKDIQSRLLGAELLFKLRKVDLPGFDLAEARRVARAADKAVRAGTLGYALLLAERQ